MQIQQVASYSDACVESYSQNTYPQNQYVAPSTDARVKSYQKQPFPIIEEDAKKEFERRKKTGSFLAAVADEGITKRTVNNPPLRF